MPAHAAAAIMEAFAERTGVTGVLPQQRYLWTDAFAVCNYIGRAADDPQALPAARALIEAVHGVLGRHRGDDPRQGALSGLSETEAAAHPTRGGLRIGKPLAERGTREGYDARLEWERDGQYFHYLTRWMHALDQMSGATGDPTFNRWAAELAETACSAFDCRDRGGPPLAWKMSVDLSRPQVPAMGHHDPLDGYITCRQLQRRAALLGAPQEPTLDAEVAHLEALMRGRAWTTDDPLGLGGLMTDAYRVLQLEAAGTNLPTNLLPELLGAVDEGLSQLLLDDPRRDPAEQRLPFRELGLAIGLKAISRLAERAPPDAARLRPASGIAAHAPMADGIVEFWQSADAQQAPTWRGHLDINAVMLATALEPAGYLELGLWPGLAGGPGKITDS